MKFENRIVVVTGGGSGIGKQITNDLCMEGAVVCILGRRKERLEETKREIEQKQTISDRIFSYLCDVSSHSDVNKVFNEIKKAVGPIFGLVNCAGVNPSRTTIMDTTIEHWNETIQINLTGTFNCSKAAITQLLEQREGSIVNISSIAGITALPQRAAYMSSKFGVIGLTKSMALDFASKNIRVNVICPGYVKTDLVSRFLKELKREQYNKLVQAHPLLRLGTTEDISKAVLFLLSDDARWITGITLPVDGGYSIGKEY